MEARVGDDPDRDRPRRQRDHPHPIALTTQVVGRELPQPLLGHPTEELLVVRIGPVLDVEPAVEPEPGRVHLVPVLLQQIQLALQQKRPPRGIHDPPRPHLAVLTLIGHADHVWIDRDVDVLDATVTEQVNALRQRLLPQVVLEPPPVELVARLGQRLVDPALDPLRDRRVPGRREPPAQPELVELVVVHVLARADDIGEVVRGHLDGRLPDLERRLGRPALALLGDEDARLGTCLLELDPESQPGQAAAEDRHVVAVSRLPISAHVALLVAKFSRPLPTELSRHHGARVPRGPSPRSPAASRAPARG